MSNTDDVKIQKISKMLEIGGTMLAQHCNNCGAPLFRYQGRVLCPVCDDVRDPRGAMGQANDTAPISSAGNEVSPVDTMEEPVAARPESIPSPVAEPVRTEPSKPLVQGSVSELESLIISKMTGMAREMQDEKDPRRIDEYLDLIDRCMDILAKMQ
ncbi:Sjogren's syndrome/scleroderma autoantigen 1 family protein [Methanolobus sp. WCC4]|uniref:Sjogren's syndrome/scleroderma autoantigen 1 family protein n=1 Tax=Methanolobus sp. WCC4 TaxID=3125784 RepID=UPI0030F5A1DE